MKPDTEHNDKVIRGEVQPDTEDDLFLAYRDENDIESFNRLFKMTKPWLFGMIYRITGEKDAAEDILQETWVKMIEQAERYNPAKGKVKNYVFTIAKNKALQWKAGEKRFDRSKDLDTGKSVDPDKEYEMSELGEIIRTEISKLKNKNHIDSMLMFYFADLEVVEIAKRMNTGEQNIKNWLKRGRDKIEMKLKKHKEFNAIYETVMNSISNFLSMILPGAV